MRSPMKWRSRRDPYWDAMAESGTMSSEKTTPAVTRMVVPRLIRNIRVSATSPIRTRRLTQTISFGIRASTQLNVQASRTATTDMINGVNQKFTRMRSQVIRVRTVHFQEMLIRHRAPASRPRQVPLRGDRGGSE